MDKANMPIKSFNITPGQLMSIQKKISNPVFRWGAFEQYFGGGGGGFEETNLQKFKCLVGVARGGGLKL